MNESLPERIARLDSHHFHEILSAFPDQAEEGYAIGGRTDPAIIETGRVGNIVVTGMGGSAIGGDILRSYAAGECRLPFAVNRGYALPAHVGERTLVIASSYSGDTEETLSAYAEARNRNAQVVVITSGGALAARAETEGAARILIPGGLAPRCALGYGFFPLLHLFFRWGFLDEERANVGEVFARIRGTVRSCADTESGEALEIARRLHGSVPIIYSAAGPLEAVNVRWRCQIEENAKVLSYGNFFPELNHNEIVGWELLPDLLRRFAIVFLRDPSDAPQTARRMEITREMLSPLAAATVDCAAGGESLLARIFGLICLGDWVSFHLAMINGVDPHPITKIDALKKALRTSPSSPPA